MVDALRDCTLAHAGLDVFDPEPPLGTLPALENVTMTSHAGYKTPEASLRPIQMAFQRVIRLI